MKIYKVQTKYIVSNSLLFVGPLILMIIAFSEPEPLSQGEWLGISIFTLVASLITFLPLANKLEVGNDYMKGYFLGFKMNYIRRSDVEVFEYGNLFRFGGLGVGKGIKMWVKTPNGRKYQSVGEKAFGKEAIQDIKRALSKDS